MRSMAQNTISTATYLAIDTQQKRHPSIATQSKKQEQEWERQEPKWKEHRPTRFDTDFEHARRSESASRCVRAKRGRALGMAAVPAAQRDVQLHDVCPKHARIHNHERKIFQDTTTNSIFVPADADIRRY